ncbi:uncharacterized protein SCHCODRAFT_02573813 [Schizophyllum commune H4-8]|nr:uncharacterized protein SCHCODRAFT_02573813 [Schizophyllum commune H4-8]KAI5895787.1 hypothetical protein SCHCODRAFT_02573813 [Schizophyllum commune H4-8]
MIQQHPALVATGCCNTLLLLLPTAIARRTLPNAPTFSVIPGLSRRRQQRARDAHRRPASRSPTRTHVQPAAPTRPFPRPSRRVLRPPPSRRARSVRSHALLASTSSPLPALAIVHTRARRSRAHLGKCRDRAENGSRLGSRASTCSSLPRARVGRRVARIQPLLDTPACPSDARARCVPTPHSPLRGEPSPALATARAFAGTMRAFSADAELAPSASRGPPRARAAARRSAAHTGRRTARTQPSLGAPTRPSDGAVPPLAPTRADAVDARRVARARGWPRNKPASQRIAALPRRRRDAAGALPRVAVSSTLTSNDAERRQGYAAAGHARTLLSAKGRNEGEVNVSEELERYERDERKVEGKDGIEVGCTRAGGCAKVVDESKRLRSNAADFFRDRHVTRNSGSASRAAAATADFCDYQRLPLPQREVKVGEVHRNE